MDGAPDAGPRAWGIPAGARGRTSRSGAGVQELRGIRGRAIPAPHQYRGPAGRGYPWRGRVPGPRPRRTTAVCHCLSGVYISSVLQELPRTRRNASLQADATERVPPIGKAGRFLRSVAISGGSAARGSLGAAAHITRAARQTSACGRGATPARPRRDVDRRVPPPRACRWSTPARNRRIAPPPSSSRIRTASIVTSTVSTVRLRVSLMARLQTST